jgi:hypothetical protein
VGSTPTGAFSQARYGRASGARRPVLARGGRRRVFRAWVMTIGRVTMRLAQRIEHQTKDLAVTGSTPVPPRGRKPAPTRPEEGGPTSDRPPAGVCRRFVRLASPLLAARPSAMQCADTEFAGHGPNGRGCSATRAGSSPATTSRAEAALPPEATRILKRHSALVRVIAAGSAPDGLFD